MSVCGYGLGVCAKICVLCACGSRWCSDQMLVMWVRSGYVLMEFQCKKKAAVGYST